jgi:hypothetical protein
MQQRPMTHPCRWLSTHVLAQGFGIMSATVRALSFASLASVVSVPANATSGTNSFFMVQVSVEPGVLFAWTSVPPLLPSGA